ncbi:anthranilate synthase component II [Idiomarina seosinensis]|uniref:Aminodeoxychorismate/anthranilate synthase component II n=1 Tax=Idiomarina seosinensis TaxID=281739 RepID=A0A432Z766_9GAMM|nr:aminodeoxychorismate/anthranilate synthase component II [Idiomarina seosinensis]RUO73730.1 aminodeoxychorismate/anthranilate synthase component II [Idiomarina seosinensis]
MVVLIDNYDSFSHNLARYLVELGAQVQVYRNDQVTVERLRQLPVSAIVISPGPCTPSESGVSLEVIKSFAGQLPVLGVCLGHQAIAQVFGAKIVRATNVMHGKISMICHNSQGMFTGLPSPLPVTRYHSLVIAADTLPESFAVDAWLESDDYGLEIMAIRHKQLPIFGVQFHPESVMTKQGHQLLRQFLAVVNNDKYGE